MKTNRLTFYLAAWLTAVQWSGLDAQARKPPPAAQPAAATADDEVIPAEVTEADKIAATVEVRDSYYVKSPSYSTEPIDGANPPYVKRLSETGLGALKHIDWIIFGIEQRTRGEFRENDFRRANSPATPVGPAGSPAIQETPLLFRTRGFLKLEFDWFRVMTEVQDSRRTPIATSADTRDFNYVEPIQAYAEFHFKNLFGYNRPLAIRGGRYSLELGDRRLVALNEWRNTTNTFQGGWILIGKRENNWDLNLLGAQPLVREIEKLDQPIGQQWFYGGILSIRQWSEWVTLQPFYFGLNQDGQAAIADWYPTSDAGARFFRNIHTIGGRGYAVVGKTGFDYDFSYIRQFGVDQLNNAGVERNQDAFAATAEVGYTFKHPWKPRLAGLYAYASGDVNRADNTQNRFERLYGFARPWSANDYFQYENIETPKVIFEFEPIEKLKIDTSYIWYWVASPTDRWNNANILNNATAAGNANTDAKLGEEYNIRIRYPFPHLKVNIGYAYFKAGAYTEKFKRPGDSHFAYLELSALLWD
ncbi:MAG: alginate export family protein [Spirochaetota bacterium]